MIEKMEISKILRRALQNGGDFADLYEEKTLSTQIVCERKQFTKALHGQDHGVGLRVLYDGKTAYGYTNDISESSLLELASGIADAVRGRAFDQNITLSPTPPNWHPLVEKDPKNCSLEDKAKLVKQADEAAWPLSPHLQQVTCIYRDQIKEIRMANSLGEMTEESRCYVVFVAQVVAAKNGVVQTGYEPLGGHDGYGDFFGG